MSDNARGRAAGGGPHKLLVFQSDFGRQEGTVAQMYGVALKVDPALVIHEISHEIPRFDTWEASYRLFQTLASWPEGTVFVSVIDPGVGSSRRSVAARTASGHYIVSPDNGSLSHVAARFGLEALREIDEETERAPGSEHSHTFHGRDVYGYNGARLASGTAAFGQLGKEVDPQSIVRHPFPEPQVVRKEGQEARIEGIVEIIDLHFGNVWTNIPLALFEEAGFRLGDTLSVRIRRGEETVFERQVPYGRSFSAVEQAEPLVYANELLYAAIALNRDSFAAAYGVGCGPRWTIRFEKVS